MKWLDFQTRMENKGWNFEGSSSGLILTPPPGSRGVKAEDRIRRAWAMNSIEADKPININCFTAEDWADKIGHLFLAALRSGVRREQEELEKRDVS